jgi:hypothetical protein
LWHFNRTVKPITFGDECCEISGMCVNGRVLRKVSVALAVSTPCTLLSENDAQYAECTILTQESGTTVVRALGNQRFEFRDPVLCQDGAGLRLPPGAAKCSQNEQGLSWGTIITRIAAFFERPAESDSLRFVFIGYGTEHGHLWLISLAVGILLKHFAFERV